MKATELQIVRGGKHSKYPEDVDQERIDEFLHFHLYVRQSQKLTEEHSLSVSHEGLYQIMCKEKFTLPLLMWKQYSDYFLA